MYLDYSDYVIMGGAHPQGLFERVNAKAQSLITAMTHGRVESEDPARDALKYAAFDLVEAMANDAASGADTREIVSMSNDGASVTYASGSSSRARYAGILRSFLDGEKDENGTPLMYAGVDA